MAAPRPQNHVATQTVDQQNVGTQTTMWDVVGPCPIHLQHNSPGAAASRALAGPPCDDYARRRPISDREAKARALQRHLREVENHRRQRASGKPSWARMRLF